MIYIMQIVWDQDVRRGYMMKYHLARLSTHDADVMPCMVSSAEVIQKTLEAIAEQDRKKVARERPMVSDR